MAQRRYLYEAKGDDGKVKCGYLAADTLAHAREQLLALGLRDVALIDDDLTAELRLFGERAGGVEPGADMDLALRYRPTARSVAWLALRANGFWVVAALLLAAYLWSAGSPGWALALGALVLLPATFPAWVQWRENEILREFWRGNYESSERIARGMRAMRFVSRSPIAQLELDGRIAAAMAKRGDLAGAIAQLEPWQGSDKVPAPTPLVKLANVYFLARDWPRAAGRTGRSGPARARAGGERDAEDGREPAGLGSARPVHGLPVRGHGPLRAARARAGDVRQRAADRRAARRGSPARMAACRGSAQPKRPVM